jgi:hypothetical protein
MHNRVRAGSVDKAEEMIHPNNSCRFEHVCKILYIIRCIGEQILEMDQVKGTSGQGVELRRFVIN